MYHIAQSVLGYYSQVKQLKDRSSDCNPSNVENKLSWEAGESGFKSLLHYGYLNLSHFPRKQLHRLFQTEALIKIALSSVSESLDVY